MQILIIKGELPDLNTEINSAKKHWSYYAKHKKTWTTIVMYEAKKQLYKITYPKLHLEFFWYTKNKRKDPDNVAFAKKYILDGIKEAGIIPDDSMTYIVSFADFFHIDTKNPRVEVHIFNQNKRKD